MANLWEKIKGRVLQNPPSSGLICSEIFESMSILADGSVTCSCVDIFEGRVLGNVNEQSLYEIFENEKYRDLRAQMLSGDLPPQCRQCPLRVRPRTGSESVNGCRITWLQIDPIFNCNLRCPDCALTQMRRENFFIRPKTQMSLETFKGIIDQTAPTLQHIRFHMLGEPFMNKQATDMLLYAKGKCPNVFISIETNGLLINSEIQKALVEAGVDYVKFSIDGASQETYEKYRVGGDFEKAFGNMAGLVRIRNAHHSLRPKVIWQYILFKWNDSTEEIRRAKHLAKRAGVDELFWLITHSPGASERYLPGRHYPILEGERESLNETIELASKRGKPMPRPAPTLAEYNPWK